MTFAEHMQIGEAAEEAVTQWRRMGLGKTKTRLGQLLVQELELLGFTIVREPVEQRGDGDDG